MGNDGFRFRLQIFELGGFFGQQALQGSMVTVSVFFVLDITHHMLMLLGQDDVVLDGKYRGVVMLLMNLTVESYRGLFMSLWNDSLFGDCGCYRLL